MHPETDDAAVQADAYIDALLAGHGRMPLAVSGETEPEGHDAIRLLEKGLPRFHPSFVFEEWLSGQLRQAAEETRAEDGERKPGDIVQIVSIVSANEVQSSPYFGSSIRESCALFGDNTGREKRNRERWRARTKNGQGARMASAPTAPEESAVRAT